MTSLQHNCEPHNRALLTRRDLLGAGVGSIIAACRRSPAPLHPMAS
jgi:hypothetical protein